MRVAAHDAPEVDLAVGGLGGFVARTRLARGGERKLAEGIAQQPQVHGRSGELVVGPGEHDQPVGAGRPGRGRREATRRSAAGVDTHPLRAGAKAIGVRQDPGVGEHEVEAVLDAAGRSAVDEQSASRRIEGRRVAEAARGPGGQGLERRPGGRGACRIGENLRVHERGTVGVSPPEEDEPAARGVVRQAREAARDGQRPGRRERAPSRSRKAVRTLEHPGVGEDRPGLSGRAAVEEETVGGGVERGRGAVARLGSAGVELDPLGSPAQTVRVHEHPRLAARRRAAPATPARDDQSVRGRIVAEARVRERSRPSGRRVALPRGCATRGARVGQHVDVGVRRSGRRFAAVQDQPVVGLVVAGGGTRARAGVDARGAGGEPLLAAQGDGVSDVDVVSQGVRCVRVERRTS